MLCFAIAATFLLFTVGEQVAADESWMRFRGPNGSGASEGEAPLPVEWSDDLNLAWKNALPGPGASSPIVVGSRVWVTCYSGYGTPEDTERDIRQLKRHLCCYDLTSGSLQWQQAVAATLPEDSYYDSGVSSHGYASHTPVTDGERVYAFFGKTGVIAFDIWGEKLWSRKVGSGSDPPKWGSSSSPILHRDLLIVTAAAESQSLFGLHKLTGEVVWKYQSSGLDGMWGTPAIVSIDGGHSVLVMMVAGELWGFDPANGERLWTQKATESRQAYASVVCDGPRLFAFSGSGGGSLAVRLQQDLVRSPAPKASPEVLWRSPIGTTYATPILHQDKLYSISRNILTVMDAKSGQRLDQIRLKGAKETGGPFGSLDYPSPVIHSRKLYYLNARGQVYVFDLDSELEPIAINELGSEKETFWGSPAIADGKLILRSNRSLYCIEQAREHEVDPAVIGP